MAKVNDLLIVEMSSSQLSVASNEGKEYVLEGIFGEIDTKNKNNRIYTEDEYVPQIQQLQDKIKSSKLLGELDHPQQFDVSLKNVSHIIEELFYDKDNNRSKRSNTSDEFLIRRKLPSNCLRATHNTHL
jgi:hypothetical protein